MNWNKKNIAASDKKTYKLYQKWTIEIRRKNMIGLYLEKERKINRKTRNRR